MCNDRCGHNQPRQSKSIRNLLHVAACRAERRRRDIRAAVVVHHAADYGVDGRHAGLAHEQGWSVLGWIAHFRHNREESRRSCKGKD